MTCTSFWAMSLTVLALPGVYCEIGRIPSSLYGNGNGMSLHGLGPTTPASVHVFLRRLPLVSHLSSGPVPVGATGGAMAGESQGAMALAHTVAGFQLRLGEVKRMVTAACALQLMMCQCQKKVIAACAFQLLQQKVIAACAFQLMMCGLQKQVFAAWAIQLITNLVGTLVVTLA